ncbi:MAG: outer membrane protein assembly factor BamD [Kofleriaceae bacterium]
MSDLVRAAMTHDDRLDDITRARVWNAIEDRIAAEPAPRSRRGLVIAGGLCAAAAAAAIVVFAVPRDNATHSIAVVRDATLSSPIGPYTRAAIVGPAELAIVGTPGEATAVQLRSGTFVAEFTGGTGRSLRVETPHAVVDIVGTVFAVTVGDATCVAVSHGRVRVTTAALAVLEVGAGSRYCTDAGASAIPPELEQTLQRHGQVITARVVEPPKPAPIVTPLPPESPRIAAPPRIAPTPRIATPPRIPAPPRIAAPPPPPPTRIEPVAKIEPAPSRTIEPTPAPPIATPPVEAPRPPPAPATADELYRTAETALAKRDAGAADRAFDRLVTAYPASPLVEQALYERALIAHRAHAWGTARRHLDRLLALPAPRLAEPARYLACRIAVEAHDGEAASCLVDYRRSYPRSPHDRDVLALLVQLDHAANGCAGARARIAELVRRYPTAPLATAWTTRCKVSP